MTYKNILFDLDGTLTDPAMGIKNSIRYALNKQNRPVLNDETLNAFIGPPLIDTFMKFCDVTREEAESLVADYREYFRSKGMFENKVYPMIPEMLTALKKDGCSLFVATSKPEPFAKTILEHFDLAKYFDFIGGSTLQETRTTKTEVIEYVLKENHLNVKDCLMVGDRCYDIEGAKNCNIKVAAVLFGYGDKEELKDADFIIASPMELLSK
ncbi:MAG: HAD-IA family hydrolase [Clostridia bacterium]|nr:HAD-IA family hydrolase [Clostridia bacterium]